MAEKSKALNSKIDFVSNGFDREKCFNQLLRVCKKVNILVFCSNMQLCSTLHYFETRGYRTTTLVWHKTNPTPFCYGSYLSDIEFLVYAREQGIFFNKDTPYDYKRKVYTSGATKEGNLHPTQKPLKYITQLVLQHCQEGGVVLDCFMGSGTTAIACIREKRHFIGFELNKEFFDKACKRIEIEQMQPTLF